jgi:DNA-binding beta-propeller fold protein YncE
MRSTPLWLLPLALAGLACGARTSLDGGEGSGGGLTGGGTADIFGGATILVLDSETFQGRSRIDAFADIWGKGHVAFEADGTLADACGPSLDGAGGLYFGDGDGLTARLVRVDLATGVLTSLSTDPQGARAFVSPGATAVDAKGRIYVVDAGLHRIVRVDDLSGHGFTTLGGPSPGSGVGQLDTPRGIALTSAGKILVTDEGNRRVVQMDDLSGAGWITWSMPALGADPPAPAGIAVDRSGRILAVDFQHSLLYRMHGIDGSGLETFILPQQLSHVTVAPDGRVFAGFGNGIQAIAELGLDGGLTVTTLTGPPGGQWKNPCGLVVR